MLIAIDGNEANLDHKVGVNRYAFEILWSFYRLKKRSPDLRKIDFVIFLSRQPRPEFPSETKGWHYEVFGPKFLWTFTGLVKRLYFGSPRPDLLFSPSHYGPLFSPIPFVVSIMDLGFLRWPRQFTKKDFFQLKYGTRFSVKRASRVVTISKFSKEDIAKTYGIDPNLISVAYPGWQKNQGSKKTLSQSLPHPGATDKQKPKKQRSTFKNLRGKFRIKGSYLLYLGTLKPSKNLEGLIEAFRLLTEERLFSELKLVIAGKKGWLYQDIFKRGVELGLQKKIVFTGFVPDPEIKKLIRNASAFIMPSFWEGFGIPALEAMAEGTPVICSNKAALPEVVGKAALLINPYSAKDISDKIKEVLTDQRLRKRLIKLGRDQAGKFDWDNSGQAILNLLIKTK